MKKILSILVVVLLTTGLFAQAPQKMSYQAVVRNSIDALVQNTSIGMQISILRGSANGTAVYVERHFPTTNANGLATIEIGAGTIVSGGFPAINWANGPYFVKTETDLKGGANYTITGANQLLSVPYALTSEVAANALTANIATNALTANVADNANLLGGKTADFYTGRVIQASSPRCGSSCPQLTVGSTDLVTINSVTITVPGPGKIFVSFSGYISIYRDSSGKDYLYVGYHIFSGSSSGVFASKRGEMGLGYSSHSVDLSNTFTVSKAGTYTYSYQASYYTTNPLPCTFYGGNMSAIYTQD